MSNNKLLLALYTFSWSTSSTGINLKQKSFKCRIAYINGYESLIWINYHVEERHNSKWYYNLKHYIIMVFMKR